MKKHIGPHKYLKDKFKQSGTVIFKCVLPGCQHYLNDRFIIGKISLCWRCNQPFLIDKQLKELKKPHCHDCTKGRQDTTTSLIDEFVGGLIK